MLQSARRVVGAALVALIAASCGGSAAPSNRQTGTSPTRGATPRTSAPLGNTTTATVPASRADRTKGSLASRTIVLDPGHNGGNANAPSVINQLVPAGRGRTKPCNTTGTATNGGYEESAFNWDVALRLAELLRKQGAYVVLTRHSNTGVGPCVNVRAAIANSARADAVIAIHADGASLSGRGFHVIYPPDNGSTAPIYQRSLRLARDIHDAILATGAFPPSTYIGHDGYDQRDDLAGLNLSTRPAVFVELGNMRNETDAQLQINPRIRQRLAIGLDAGLMRFLNG
jgi:N-acetylmuramoyl-L-alanine amidase